MNILLVAARVHVSFEAGETEGKEKESETGGLVRCDPGMAFLNGRHNQALITSFVCPSGPLTFHLPREKVLHWANAALAPTRWRLSNEPTDQSAIHLHSYSPITSSTAPRSSWTWTWTLDVRARTQAGLAWSAITCVKHVNNLQFGIHK